MFEPTLAELKRTALSLGGIYGQARNDEDRRVAKRHAKVAKIAYHAARVLEEDGFEITQEDADYICLIIASRMKAQAAR